MQQYSLNFGDLLKGEGYGGSEQVSRTFRFRDWQNYRETVEGLLKALRQGASDWNDKLPGELGEKAVSAERHTYKALCATGASELLDIENPGLFHIQNCYRVLNLSDYWKKWCETELGGGGVFDFSDHLPTYNTLVHFLVEWARHRGTTELGAGDEIPTWVENGEVHDIRQLYFTLGLNEDWMFREYATERQLKGLTYGILDEREKETLGVIGLCIATPRPESFESFVETSRRIGKVVLPLFEEVARHTDWHGSWIADALYELGKKRGSRGGDVCTVVRKTGEEFCFEGISFRLTYEAVEGLARAYGIDSKRFMREGYDQGFYEATQGGAA
jgi:hypothetical protein